MSLQTIGCKMDHFVSQDFTWIFQKKSEAKKKKKHKPSLFYPVTPWVEPAWASFIFLEAPFKETGPKPWATWAPAVYQQESLSPSPNGNHEIQTSRRFSGVPGVKPGVDCFWEIISEHPKMQKRKRQIKSSKNALRFTKMVGKDGDCHWLGDEFPETFRNRYLRDPPSTQYQSSRKRMQQKSDSQ